MEHSATQAAHETCAPMRVLHAFKVFQPDQNGGIEEAIFRISTGAPPDADTSILVCRSKGRGSNVIVGGVPVERTGTFGQLSSLPISPTYPFRLRSRLKAADVLAFHAPFPLVDLAISIGALRDDQALVIHWHAEIVGRKWLRPAFAPLLRNSVARADRILVSNAALIEISPYLAAAREKCRVVPYGIDTHWWSALNADERAAVSIRRAKYPRLIVGCGRLVPYKGFDVLIRAMHGLDAQLIIIGMGPLEGELKTLVKSLGLESRVTFTGFLDRAEQRLWLNAARVFALSSVSEAEAFGIAQLEAMSCACPVVNTSLSTGVPFVARDGKEGLTVPPSDVESLAAAINKLLNRPDLADRLGKAGQSRAYQDYGWQAFANNANNAYRDALAERRKRRG
jgi:glycosyltransferase involved in cell wall biosynthesis